MGKNVIKAFMALVLYIFLSFAPVAFCDDWEEARTMIQSGKDFEQAGDYDKATDIYKNTVSQFPNYPDGYLQLGFGFQALKQFNSAIDAYRQGLYLSPQHRFAAEAYYNMSVSADEIGNGSEAIVYIKKALQAYTDRNDYSGVFQTGSYLQILSKKYPKVK